MLAKLHSVKLVQAVKDHMCSFSGETIKKGSRYYSISYHPAEADFSFHKEEFQTYKVSPDAMPEFIKKNVFCWFDQPSELNKDVEGLYNNLQKFWTKWKDFPGITTLLKRAKNKLSLPI